MSCENGKMHTAILMDLTLKRTGILLPNIGPFSFIYKLLFLKGGNIMSFISITEEMLNIAFTENGDKAYQTSGSYCLDYFGLVGGMRFNLDDALKLFLLAYNENPLIAIKILFFVRDIHDGLGERSIFRYTFNVLCNMYPNVAIQVLKYIPELGRYDDLFAAFNTPLKDDVIKMINEQLEKDIEAKKSGKPISLLAKWMPSINTSSKETRELASQVASALGMSKENYRKMLSFLRKGLIIENNLRERDYTFDYEKVPGKALFKYALSLSTNDVERYIEYMKAVDEGKAKINSKTIYPYEVIRKLENQVYSNNSPLSLEELNTLNTIWNSYNREGIDSKTIVVRDGSGSMYDFCPVSANSVATSLALLFAERLQGEFHNTFITFSNKPKLIKVKGNTIYEKFKFISTFNDVTNTDIEKVYDLILDVYKSPKFKKEDALDRVVIISDMEFDYCTDYSKTTYESFKEKFLELGYKLPELVFWNVRARSTHLPVTQREDNVKLVSGASSNLIDMIAKNNAPSAYDMMLECLKKYSEFDNINFN